jgi:hypothetical protein
MKQHKPIAGKETVTKSAVDAIVSAITSQAEKGQAQYGSPLMTFNGRDAGQDAIEELADATVYVQQLRMERNDLVVALEKMQLRCVELERERDTWRSLCQQRSKKDTSWQGLVYRSQIVTVSAADFAQLRVAPEFVPVYEYAGADYTPERGEVGFHAGMKRRLVLSSDQSGD